MSFEKLRKWSDTFPDAIMGPEGVIGAPANYLYARFHVNWKTLDLTTEWSKCSDI